MQLLIYKQRSLESNSDIIPILMLMQENQEFSDLLE